MYRLHIVATVVMTAATALNDTAMGDLLTLQLPTWEAAVTLTLVLEVC